MKNLEDNLQFARSQAAQTIRGTKAHDVAVSKVIDARKALEAAGGKA